MTSWAAKPVPSHSVWILTANKIDSSRARWGLWATLYSELSTNPPGLFSLESTKVS